MTNSKLSSSNVFKAVFALILATSSLNSYCLFVKNEGKDPITSFSLMSERNSGTHYAAHLLQRNTHLIPNHFGHAHFIPWFSLSEESYWGPKQHYTLEESSQHLFVLVVRDPYTWSQSFHKHPHHSIRKLKNLPYSQFIRAKWVMNPNEPVIKEVASWNPLIDLDPETGKNFANIFKLRTAKSNNYLLVREKVDNFVAIRYEDLRDHPKEVLEEISSLFSIPLKPFEAITSYKGNKKMGMYKKKTYPFISNQDIDFINSQLDEELEGLFGYPLRESTSLQK